MPLIRIMAPLDSIIGITDPSTNVLIPMAPLGLITFLPLATELNLFWGKAITWELLALPLALELMAACEPTS